MKARTNHYVFPDICGLAKDVYEKEFIAEEKSFSGNGREVGVEGIHLWYQSLEFHQKRTWLIENNAARVQMNFNLQGKTSFYSDKLGKVFVRFQGGQHNLMLIPEGKMRLQWPAGERTEIFSLSLSTGFFFDTLPDGHPLGRHFEKGVDLQLPAFMSLRNLPVTPRMAQVLFEILHCEYEGHYKKLFVRAKTVELLLLQLDQYENLPLPDFSSRLESEHAEQMHQVKRMLDEHLDRSWSLKDLAHVVGTNEFNLKKYFKEVFGTTVFNYLHEVRMETSRKELCKPGSTINDVAQRVGYKHATHFTAAFKKFHGVLPTKLRAAL
ncbi:helix-turn-helix transcriptional regulator [Dyadobacter beijingensis]|uniref:helix-turn-helix transcriptional regulator n=1 Tax=Dyadobacter beijingensis TaxID=365489 RepID=UPI001E554C3E|nr:AraC family transcriptional regulator [Dyadobacter beijingensis]